jgi:hypothetical protein
MTLGPDFMRRLFVAVLTAAAVAAPAGLCAQTEAQAVAIGEAISAERWAEATALTRALPAEVRDAPQLRFLEAFLARQRGKPYEAIDIYQRMLDDDASLVRVRLELADTFREIGDDRAAEYNFRLALSSDPPVETRTRVEAILREISERRRWRYGVSLAVSPDSNVNMATDAREAMIFGLPFELSDEARRVSGTTATATLHADRTVPIAGRWRLAVGGAARFADNAQSRFDDGSLSLRAGPQVFVGSDRWEARAAFDRRWFGGEWLSRTSGLEVEVQRPRGNTVVEASATALRLKYDATAVRDAWIYGLSVKRTRFVKASRFWSVTGSASRGEAESSAESFWVGQASAGLYQALPANFAVFVEPSIEVRRYDDVHPLFGVERHDTEVAVAARLLKRDWRIRGFSPYVAVERSHNQSSIELEEYNRTKLDFGLTRTF